ncbi:MAG TPA: class I SAM-dependent methyltransferase [Planctomycetota bacterium]
MTPEPIFQALLGYRLAAVLRAAIELDYLGAIAAGRRSAKAVAAARGGTERSARMLLDALAAAAPALLRKSGSAYALTPVARKYLVKGSPAYLGDLMPLYGHRRMWDAFYELPKTVRAGTSTAPSNAHSENQEFWETFARATYRDALPKGRKMVELLGPLPTPCAVLDLACGSGGYGEAFAAAGADVTLFDQANVLKRTRTLVRAKVKYAVGDLFKTPFGGPYDVILASHVYHHFDEKACVALTRKIARALKPGGRLVIQEFVADEGRSKKVQPLMFAVTMLVWTKAGDAYRVSDFRRWLRAAGLGRLRYYPLAMPGDLILVTKQTV